MIKRFIFILTLLFFVGFVHPDPAVSQPSQESRSKRKRDYSYFDKKFEEKARRNEKIKGRAKVNKAYDKRKKYRLSFLAKELGEILSCKKSPDYVKTLFVAAEDLESIGINQGKIKKIAEKMKTERKRFYKKIEKYCLDNPKKRHILKIIEMKEVELLPFKNLDHAQKGIQVIALKNVVFYYLRLGAFFENSDSIQVDVPSIFLIKNRWRISEFQDVKKFP